MKKSHKNSRTKMAGSYRWIIKKGESFDNIAGMIGKASGNVFAGPPSQMIGTAERGTGRIMRVKATYGPGETVVLNLRKDKSYSVSFGLRLVTKVTA